MIDMALIRPGRFDKIVFVPKPDRKTRQVILEIYVKDKPIGQDVNMKTIADATEGFSGADVSAIANTAVSLVLHEYLQRYPTPENGKTYLRRTCIHAPFRGGSQKDQDAERDETGGESESVAIQVMMME